MKGVYLLHFEPKYKHAGHYLGYAEDIVRRVEEHRSGTARVRLTDAAANAGVKMFVTRTWPGASRDDERKMKGTRRPRGGGKSKAIGSLARICPACKAKGEQDVYTGRLIQGLESMVDNKLKGVQLPLRGRTPLSYRADSGNGTLVLCDRHLDLRRDAGETWKLTGESFPVDLCDDCE